MTFRSAATSAPAPSGRPLIADLTRVGFIDSAGLSALVGAAKRAATHGGSLQAFKKISGDTVVWERWDFCWRKREATDVPSRKQE